MELENSASQDAVVREKIANLPAEVQDVSLLEKIEGTMYISSFISILSNNIRALFD